MLRAYRNCTLLFFGVKSPANCDAHLAESYFRTRLAEILYEHTSAINISYNQLLKFYSRQSGCPMLSS